MTISKRRIEKMVKTAIQKRIKLTDSDDYEKEVKMFEAADEEWAKVVKSAEDFVEVYEAAIKNADVLGVGKIDPKFTGLINMSKEKYGEFLNSIWDIENGIRMVYHSNSITIQTDADYYDGTDKSIRSSRSVKSSKVGDRKPLRDLDGNGYEAVQGEDDIRDTLDIIGADDDGYGYLIVKMGDGDYDEVWAGRNADLSTGFERLA